MINVLIIEDDPMVAEINKTFLSRIPGFSLVGIVHNGIDALAFLEQPNHDVDLIFLDVFMPQMDGLAFLKRLKQLYPGIDVIMVTAAQTGKDIKYALNCGVVDYIIKPFTFDRMAMSLNSYKSRVEILKDASSVEQSVLDKRIFQQSPKNPFELPKGIDKKTLASVKRAVARQRQEFSTQELAGQLDISRISLKKYLNYLVNQGVLEERLKYRSKGRPILMYWYTEHD